MKGTDLFLATLIGLIIGTILCASISNLLILNDINKYIRTNVVTYDYIKENVITYDKLDSILDVRLGSGCDLSIDSCDVYPY